MAVATSINSKESIMKAENGIAGREKERKIMLDGKELKPKELTVRQVMDVLEDLVGQDVHILESVCPDEPVPAVAASLSVGVDPDELTNLTPSEVKELFSRVKKQNPFLVDAMEKLITIAGPPEALQKEELKTFAEPVAD